MLRNIQFFNDTKAPLDLTWKLLVDKIFKKNACLYPNKLTSSAVTTSFKKLIKDYMVAILKDENWSYKDWAMNNLDMLDALREILIQAEGLNFTDIEQRLENPRRTWSPLYDEWVNLDDSPTSEEILHLYTKRLNHAYLQHSSPLSSPGFWSNVEKLLSHLMSMGMYDENFKAFTLFSKEIIRFFIAAIEVPEYQYRLQNALRKLSNFEIKTKEGMDISESLERHILARCMNTLYQDNINNEKNTKFLHGTMLASLHEIINPFYPQIVNKKMSGFYVRWLFNSSEQAQTVTSTLAKLGLSPKTGRVNGEFGVDLPNVEPVDIVLAHQKFKFEQRNDVQNNRRQVTR